MVNSAHHSSRGPGLGSSSGLLGHPHAGGIHAAHGHTCTYKLKRVFDIILVIPFTFESLAFTWSGMAESRARFDFLCQCKKMSLSPYLPHSLQDSPRGHGTLCVIGPASLWFKYCCL